MAKRVAKNKATAKPVRRKGVASPKEAVAASKAVVVRRRQAVAKPPTNHTPKTSTTSKPAVRPTARPHSTSARLKKKREPVPEKVILTRLTPEELQEFRELLLAKRREIVGDMGSLTDGALGSSRQDAAGDLSLMPNHMADLGSDNWEQEFNLGLIENQRVVLREIDEALERIDHRTYGICLGTGKPITKARLRAKPWAKYCIEYARIRERNGLS